MATSVRLIRRYVWLIDTIRRAGHITLDEINEKWLQERTLRLEDETDLPERTFHRHRQAIADIFGIDILCNRYDGNTYYIENDDVLSKPSFTSWLFNGLAIDNQLMGNKDIAKRIVFEEIPGGSDFLSPLIEAMTKNRVVQLSYMRFASSTETTRIVQPYGLKQSGRRWYLIALICGCNGLKVFALDRIVSVRITDDTFEPEKQLDVKSYFDEVVGVNVDDDFDKEEVVVRIYGRQRDYIETLPIHKSQHLIARCSGYSDYSFMLRPEYEFQRSILALGPNAEILSPQWLREELKWLAEETVKRYSNT
ncbi:MAG: WYL domain-containing protein [Muribaculaceae bacterium]|nr:WYL domain-containing protein [Muribaculaceae bacterium]